MHPTRAVLLASMVLLAGFAGAPTLVAGQEDLVTLTVSVETPEGVSVGDARLTAFWDGGSSPTRPTASNGKAFIDVPAGEDVTVRMTHDEYVRNRGFAVADASAREVTMTVYPKASARVVVEDGDGPVADAQVTLSKNGFQVAQGSTGEDGTYDAGTVEEGLYTVSVAKAGYYAHREDVDVSGDVQVPVTIERGTVTLEVNVTDDHFEPPRPVGQATANVDGSGSVTTQPTGIGRISVPVNAWATVHVDKDGYEPTTEQVYVGESDAQVAIAIQRTPAISVELLSQRVVIGERVSLSVTDEYGDPVSAATVRLDGEVVAETDDAGQAVVRIESTGNHSVVVEKGTLSTDEHTVVGVEPGGDAESATTESEEPAKEGTETESELPGFGVVVALLAILVLVGLGVRWTRL